LHSFAWWIISVMGAILLLVTFSFNANKLVHNSEMVEYLPLMICTCFVYGISFLFFCFCFFYPFIEPKDFQKESMYTPCIYHEHLTHTHITNTQDFCLRTNSNWHMHPPSVRSTHCTPKFWSFRWVRWVCESVVRWGCEAFGCICRFGPLV